MSEKNVELAHRMVDAWNRRDLETFQALSDPEIEYVNSPTAVEPGVRRGIDAVTAVTRTQWEMIHDARWEIDRIYDRGDEIIVLGRLSRQITPDSEARLEDRSLISWTFREGKAIRAEVLGFGVSEVQTAVKTAGLEE